MAEGSGGADDVRKDARNPDGAFVGFTRLMGLRLTRVDEQQVDAELTVTPEHYQPMGIVHGGVYCAMVETVCSVAGYVHSSKAGQFVVGVDNTTSFLKATRAGVLRAVAKPITIGRRTHLWEASVHDDQGNLVASGRVRLMAVEAGAMLGGAAAGIASEPPKR